jgi:nitroreductase
VVKTSDERLRVEPTGTVPRRAQTQVPIHPDIAARWSPRMFDGDAVLKADDLVAVLEAARWAATWGHRQPVRFLVGQRGDETFSGISELLKRGNSYAKAAGGLILLCTDEGEDERTARYAAVDAGAAIAQLTVEAVSRGLIAHPMAGFNADGAREVFGIPAGVRPIAVVAVGSLGDYDNAPPEIVERDAQGRGRLPLEEVAFAGRWGQPLSR